jgi:hypothetical protein
LAGFRPGFEGGSYFFMNQKIAYDRTGKFGKPIHQFTG